MLGTSFNKIVILVTCVIIVACSSNKTQTLGQLKYEEDKEKEIEFEKLSHEEVREEYKELIDLFEDKKLKERIERRIADVYMMEANEDIATQEQEDKSEYIEAIKAYRNILERYPNSPDNAEVFYQLAKAYDLEGKTKEAMDMLTELVRRHPTYVNIAEAHFRKADIHFNWGEYGRAKTSYLAVTQLTDGRLKLNAKYMLGWVYYKELNFMESIDAFAFVLNSILVEGKTFDTLTKAEKPLVSESVHSISLALDKVGGADTIPEVNSIANQWYIWRIYDYLGDYYLEKELYEQSAKTYRAFVNRFPSSEKSPGLHNKLIDAYTKGKFPRLALEEKETYISAYGIYSKYPGNQDGINKTILTSLKLYIDELAAFNYAEGQSFLDGMDKEKKRNKENADKTKLAQAAGKAKESFNRSAKFYAEFLETFPGDARVDEIRFLRAEANFLAGNYLLAAEDYELVAYAPVGSSAKDEAADSGYAAIISYQNHIGSLEAKSGKKAKKQVAEYRAVAVESMLRFSKRFDTDERSPTVLTNAAEYLFGLNQYDRAITVANDLIAAKKLDKTLMKTAYGIMAHSQFKLERYSEASASYLKQRNLVASNSEEYTKITERVAASIFKHAEIIERDKTKLEAANELLKIKTLAPNSAIRVTAQYDAASLLMSIEAWPKAIAELEQLVSLYPNHELSVEFPRKLALTYRKDEQWSKAAKAYMGLYNTDPNADIQREALFNAAEMFEKNGDYETAITHFKSYAYKYEQPFNMRMEARYRLALAYETIGEIGKQLYWLRRIIDGDMKGGKQRTERSQWLGAWANAKYGDYFAAEFEKTRLYQPLQKSLPKKQGFLEDANSRYQKAADYGILEFVTMSSFKIASLYEVLAVDLRRVSLPKGLSESNVALYKEIIEEQAQPLDQFAVEVHQANVDRAWEGFYDEWIAQSFDAIKRLYPERYAKEEVSVSYGEGIR